MTMLSIIQDVADRVGIPRPTSVTSSTDQQIRQLFSLLNEEGSELSKRGDWQGLTAEWTFTTTESTIQTNSPIPPDLDRFISDSFFNRTQVRKLIGPITPQEFQRIQAQPVYNKVYLSFRERRGQIMISPPPPDGNLIAYEYVSAYWAASSTGTAKEAFTADDDTTYLPENIMKMGLRWRWKHAKGLDYAEDMDTYERAATKALANDGGMRALDVAGDEIPYALWGANIPETGYGR
ncbi:hypothetical protein [Caulobacter sp. UC70_42]|uniref:hypothetical protein n=1 Tax=Caulobacter sp. UC70_42 TaxID=3374551 RepID=UPI00375750C8